jgi:signal transduction histidine kinase
MDVVRRWSDVAMASGAGVVGVLGSLGAQGRLVPPLEPLDAVGWALIALACAALVLWRRWPVTTFAIVAVAVVGYLAGRYPYGPIFLVLIVAMYGVATHVSTPRAALLCLAAFVAVVGTVLAVELPMPADDVVAYVLSWAFTLVTPLLVGVIVKLRRQSRERVRRREAELAREAFARQAYEERLALAQEVHDVVAHGLSVISMQSGGALHVFDSDPDRARQALAAIRETSREALSELRGALGMLRARSTGLDQLDELAKRMGDNGLTVTVCRVGESRPLPGAVDAAAYRIVRESLTNVLRHAGAGSAEVRLEYAAETVVVAVIDDGDAAGAATPGAEGHGIVGMRERAAQVGGTLTAGPCQDGGFAVRAVLPAGSGEEGA